MSNWLEGRHRALWIYGIPGAGKTILSTLVVDEVLTRKRSRSVGTAYFYVKHDDQASHSPSNILGSLISQLARQKSEILDIIMGLRAKHPQSASLSMALEDYELVELLYTSSEYFTDTIIMIDGLDECGPALDNDRKRFLDALAELHEDDKCSINILILSRDEIDIRKRLGDTGYQMVSIAATSGDLRLYVNAWVLSLEIRSEDLKVEVVHTLIDQVNGM